jgi:hexosaminidase
MVIYDKPDFPIRGWQDDISRGPIPTMDMLKEQIRLMSAYKLNYFTLYTEHTFKLDKHPGIAPADGITKQELRELTDYARKHHVTLIGNYQSFGHMEETLSHPDYKHLAENDHIISPALEESYDFLRDVYSEIVRFTMVSFSTSIVMRPLALEKVNPKPWWKNWVSMVFTCIT